MSCQIKTVMHFYAYIVQFHDPVDKECGGEGTQSHLLNGPNLTIK